MVSAFTLRAPSPRSQPSLRLVGNLGLLAVVALGTLFLVKAPEPPERRVVLQPTSQRAEHLRTKPIEEVRVGDWVLAKDPTDPSPPRPHRVLATPTNWTEHLVHIQLRLCDKPLEATRSHPFWTQNRGWVDAKDLAAGDLLGDEQGQSVAIARVWEQTRTADTFNLTVEGVHTFYVLAGQTPVLVHNAMPWEIGTMQSLTGPPNVGDYQQAHELLSHKWMVDNGYLSGRSGPAYLNNPAIAVPDAIHRQFNSLQYEQGIGRGSSLKGMSSNEIIRRNISIMKQSVGVEGLTREHIAEAARRSRAYARSLSKPCP